MKSLFNAYWAFTKNMENRAMDYGLNYGNPKIFLYLMRHEGCRQIDIAKNCFLKPATVSTVLTTMEQRGLIERRPSAEDNRSYEIYPTKKGKEMFKVVSDGLDDTTTAALAGFSDKEVEQLRSYLDRITANLGGHSPV